MEPPKIPKPCSAERPGWETALVNLLVYTEAKNLVNRVAQLKQLRGEHQWVVTPRRADARPTVAQEVAA